MAQLRQLLQSTPLRLSLGLVALFAVVSFASFAATFLVIRTTLEQTLHEGLVQELTGFRAAPSSEALAALVQSQSSVTDPERKILSYITPSGRVAGNAALLPADEGFRAVVLDGTNGEIDGSYFTLTERLRGGLMTVAVSAEPISNLRETFVRVFLFSLLPTTFLVLGGGLLIARRTARRLDALEVTLDRLTAGDLKARVSSMPGGADDLSRIGARIDRMAAAQEAQMSALKQVSADIAHDLKTPIQRVAVLLNRLRESKDLPERSANLADAAIAETDRIVAIFQALLQIAQIEGGSPRSRFAEVDLAALTATFVEVYGPAAEESGHVIVHDRPASPVFVQGDKTLLGQAIANLIENALRHTPSGIEIAVAVGRAGGRARISVADSGPGIPESEHENVLRRLYRLESSRTTPGSGLGLSLVAAITELHRGKLRLEDNRPGLKVTMDLPAKGTEQ